MTENWTTKITKKMKMTKNIKRYAKDTLNGYVYVKEKI